MALVCILRSIARRFCFLVYDDDGGDIKMVWEPEEPRNIWPAYREARKVIRKVI